MFAELYGRYNDMKKTIIALLTVFAALTAAQTAFADARVGCVDGDRVLREYPKFIAAQKQLAQTAERKETATRAAFDKEKDEAKKAKLVQTMQKEMAQEEEKVMKPILKTVNDAVQKVAKQKGITVVVNKSLVYYGGTDLTSEVISAVKR